jgi:hypothetical protein
MIHAQRIKTRWVKGRDSAGRGLIMQKIGKRGMRRWGRRL